MGAKFKAGDRVVHRSDKRDRKMVVVGQCFGKMPPDRGNIQQELVNAGHVKSGSYHCTWIAGAKKGEGYFDEIELELQGS